MSVTHWIIVLLVVLVVFGSSKLKNLGPDLGSAIRGFKKAMEDGDSSTNKQLKSPQKDADFASTPQSEQKSEQKNS